MARDTRAKNDRDTAETSGAGRSHQPELYPPQADELNRGVKHQIEQGSIPALEVHQLYDNELFNQGEEPYDGYQAAAVPPLDRPLIYLRGSGYLFLGSLYAFLIAAIFLLAAIYTILGGDMILAYVDRKGLVITEASGKLLLSLSLILLAVLSLGIGLAGMRWRQTPSRAKLLVLFGVAITVTTLVWIIFSLPYFDLGMGVSQVAALVYLIGAIINLKASRRYLNRKRSL